MKCPKCNSELPSNSQFCGNCGNRFVQNNIKTNNKKNIKIASSILLVIVVILLAVTGTVWFYSRNKQDVNETKKISSILDPNKPIKIKENEKYGYISSDGKVLIKPQYLSAEDFINDYAVVTVKNTDEKTNEYIKKSIN